MSEKYNECRGRKIPSEDFPSCYQGEAEVATGKIRGRVGRIFRNLTLVSYCLFTYEPRMRNRIGHTYKLLLMLFIIKNTSHEILYFIYIRTYVKLCYSQKISIYWDSIYVRTYINASHKILYFKLKETAYCRKILLIRKLN